MPYACIWKAPFTSVQLLKTLASDGGPSHYTYPQAISSDGSILYGAAQHPDGRYRAVKWNTSTLAITMLEEVFTSGDQQAIACSPDGSVVVGGTHTGSGLGVGPTMARWTSGGASGAALVGRYPDSTVGIGWAWANAPPARIVSDDGTVIVGADVRSTYGLAATGATYWRNGVAQQLPGATVSVTGDQAPQSTCVSTNGAVICGSPGQANVLGPVDADAGYWTNLTGTPTLYRLVYPSGTIDHGYNGVITCNGDGTQMWGRVAIHLGMYYQVGWWTSVSTPVGDGSHYGVFQVLPGLPNTQGVNEYRVINFAAPDPGIAIVVGYCSSGATDFHAVRWNGTGITDLGILPGGSQSYAQGCNHDGTLVCGSSLDSAANQWPVRWDASNVIHQLPSLADPSDWQKGDTYGFSRDGSTIFGVVNVGTPPSETLFCAADLFFSPTAGLVDLGLGTTRRKFADLHGAPQWLGNNAELPLGARPSVYLQAFPGNEDAFLTNALGTGGAFSLVNAARGGKR